MRESVPDLILAAWRLIRPRLLDSPEDLAQRLARRRRPMLLRPPRAWCIAIRASDQRLADHADPGPPQSQIANCKSQIADPESITLTPELIAQLSVPHTLRGHDLAHAAQILGTTPQGLRTARITQKIRTHYAKSRKGHPTPMLYTEQWALDPNAHRFAPADEAWGWTALHIHAGLADYFSSQTLTRIPIYYDRNKRYADKSNLHPEHPLVDPPTLSKRSASKGRLPPPPPDFVEYKWKDGVYLGYDWKAAERNPRIRINYEKRQRALAKRRQREREKRRLNPQRNQGGGSIEFRGYQWLCPACGRSTRVLFLPIRPINLLEGYEIPRLSAIIEIPRLLPPLPSWERAGVRGKSQSIENASSTDEPPLQSERPGVRGKSSSANTRPSTNQPPTQTSTFACCRCHRIRHHSRVTQWAWNSIIAYLTAGLLYGREVPRPAWFTKDRINAYAPRPTATPSRRRPQILELMLEGLTYRQIATKLGIGRWTVITHVQSLFAQHDVHTRRDLAKKLNREAPKNWTPKYEQVRAHLAAGLSYPEIAARMGMSCHMVAHYAAVLRQMGFPIPRPGRWPKSATKSSASTAPA